uniref:uncharacterized protein LOC120333268 n=1 Tax=Styela clava TaxID=7725 RepID=UPI001939F496|nr:uncharacterized protein LOC120333268 [Styela clava]
MTNLLTVSFIIQATTLPVIVADISCSNYPTIPENGHIFCTNGTSVGSECIFTCEPYFSLVGPRKIECAQNFSGTNWTNSTTSICIADRCKPINETVPNRYVTCTRENQVTSVCHFKCLQQNYALHPTGSKTIKCMRNKEWNGEIPCCAPPCPPHNVIDAYVLLDSSDSVGAKDWILQKKLVKHILGHFSLSPDSTKISMMRYNSIVDKKNLIYLNDYLEDRHSEFWHAVDLLPYDGTGSNIGQAIRYLISNMMLPEVGNRLNVQDLIIIFTSGKSEDNYLNAIAALQATGATVLIIVVSKSNLSNLDLLRLFHLSRNTALQLVFKESYEECLDVLTEDKINLNLFCFSSCLEKIEL